MLPKKLIVTLALASTLVSCLPTPREKLIPAARLADMDWLITKIETQYGPLKYKEQLHNIDFEGLKEKYKAQAQVDQSNEEFYMLLKKFIAEFKDGHLSGSFTRANLPGRSSIAYLGINGHRKGEGFLVTGQAVTFSEENNFPIKTGDVIVEYDGLKLRDAVNLHLTPYRNHGQDESNFTGLVSNLFIRDSLNVPLPKGKSVKIKFLRSGTSQETEIPWIVKDYLTFTKDKDAAIAKKAAKAEKLKQLEEQRKSVQGLLELAPDSKFMTEGFVRAFLKETNFDANLASSFLTLIPQRTPWDTFEYKRNDQLADLEEIYALLESKLANKSADASPIQSLKGSGRFVPEKSVPVDASKTYPAYITTMVKEKVRHSVGYIRIHSFSGVEEAKALKEFAGTIKTFRDFGVNKIVLDLIDNGGGSLSLGYQLAQLLSHENLKMSRLKVRPNDNWLDSFENTSLSAATDNERMVARENLDEALAAKNRNEWLSHEIGATTLYPFRFTPNKDLLVENEPYKLELAILVNEMCASMCDMFTSLMKENKMAKVIGKQTMGAGGNVVEHKNAPHTGLIVNITESLVISAEGVYLENNGVKPDVVIEVTESKDRNYEDVIKKGFEVLLTPPAAQDGTVAVAE
ncbi:MAG TPA: S41 family peptidase [Bacteriovoracaceae bacterium]|nr:S41 family peptidase [Bacteriovoracaceae bacterium]